MRVTQCGCGASLRVGTLIIAWLQIISGSMKSYFCGVLLAGMINEDRSWMGLFIDMKYSGYITPYFLFSGVYTLFFGIALLVSVETKHASSMKKWILGTMLHMFSAGVFVLFYAFCTLDDSASRVAFLQSEFIGEVISGYFIIVVYSYANEIIEGIDDVQKLIPT